MTTVEPNEAHHLPEIPVRESIKHEFENLVIAMQGGLWHSSQVEAAVLVLRWLRANPDSTKILLETKDES